MRRLLWLIPVVMLGLGGTVLAQDKPETPAKSKPAKSRPATVVADPATLDVGDLKPGDTKEVKFDLRNTGDVPAKNVACKGAGFTFDQAKVAIANGAIVEIKATYAAPKKGGKKDVVKQVKITCGKATVIATLKLLAAEAAAAN